MDQDEQLIAQAREHHARATKAGSEIAFESGWVAREGWQEPPGNNYWSVTAQRCPTLAEPYTVSKALTRDADVAGLLTFISTALPRLCELAEVGLSAKATAPTKER